MYFLFSTILDHMRDLVHLFMTKSTFMNVLWLTMIFSLSLSQWYRSPSRTMHAIQWRCVFVCIYTYMCICSFFKWNYKGENSKKKMNGYDLERVAPIQCYIQSIWVLDEAKWLSQFNVLRTTSTSPLLFACNDRMPQVPNKQQKLLHWLNDEQKLRAQCELYYIRNAPLQWLSN